MPPFAINSSAPKHQGDIVDQFLLQQEGPSRIEEELEGLNCRSLHTLPPDEMVKQLAVILKSRVGILSLTWKLEWKEGQVYTEKAVSVNGISQLHHQPREKIARTLIEAFGQEKGAVGLRWDIEASKLTLFISREALPQQMTSRIWVEHDRKLR